jgi:hypothetical protein
MNYWFGVIGGFLIGFSVRGFIEYYIQKSIKFHEDAIKKNLLSTAELDKPDVGEQK